MTTIVENDAAPGTEGTEGSKEDMTASTAHSTDPFTSATGDSAGLDLPSGAAESDADTTAEYMTGSFAAFALGADPSDPFDDVLDRATVRALRKWWRRFDVEQPDSWDTAPVVPVELVADALDDVPTREDVVQDADERGDEDPHDTAARLISERSQRQREKRQERAEAASAGSLSDRLLTVSGLAQLPPPTPLVDGFLYRGTLAQLAGHPGGGKTFAALGMSCALATGTRWNGSKVPEAVPVLYVAAEGSTGLLARIAAWCDVNGVPLADVEGRLHVLPEPVQLGDAEHVRQLTRMVRDTGAGLVVLDTRARCTLGLEENSATEQGLAVAAAETVIATTGAAVLVVHHLGAATQRGRGSTAWDGAVYSSLVLTKDGKGGTSVTLRCDKHKDAPDGCEHTYKLQTHTVGPETMPDADERQRSSLVLVAVDPLTEETSPTAAHLLDMIGKTCGPDGLTGSQIATFAAERSVCGRSAAYEHIRALVRTGQIANVGTEKRARYVLPTDD